MGSSKKSRNFHIKKERKKKKNREVHTIREFHDKVDRSSPKTCVAPIWFTTQSSLSQSMIVLSKSKTTTIPPPAIEIGFPISNTRKEKKTQKAVFWELWHPWPANEAFAFLDTRFYRAMNSYLVGVWILERFSSHEIHRYNFEQVITPELVKQASSTVLPKKTKKTQK